MLIFQMFTALEPMYPHCHLLYSSKRRLIVSILSCVFHRHEIDFGVALHGVGSDHVPRENLGVRLAILCCLVFHDRNASMVMGTVLVQIRHYQSISNTRFTIGCFGKCPND
jgi:hypothetical protein